MNSSNSNLHMDLSISQDNSYNTEYSTQDEFIKLKLDQLNVASTSNILFFVRDRSYHQLAKKLKVEFKKVFVCSEVKEAIKLLGKITNDSLDNSTKIDLVLIEYDLISLKLIDYINKRPTVKETSDCPIVSTILFLNESHDSSSSDIQENILNLGGVNHILRMPIPTQEVLFTLIEILHHRSKVEEIFSDLKQSRVVTAKYPHLSIFDDHIPAGGHRKLHKKGQKPGDEDNSQASESYSTIPEHRVEEIENGSECSSLLPELLNSLHRRVLNADDASETSDFHSSHSSPGTPHGSKHLRNNFGTAKSAILSKSRSVKNFFKQLENSLDEYDKDEENGLLPKQKRAAAMLLKSRDEYDLKEEENEDEEDYDDFEEEQEMIPKSEQLLHPDNRPFWSGIQSLTLEDRKKGMGFMEKNDINPFVEKIPPIKAKQSTVGGLDKKVMKKYWKMAEDPYGLENDKKLRGKSVSARDSFIATINSGSSFFTPNFIRSSIALRKSLGTGLVQLPNLDENNTLKDSTVPTPLNVEAVVDNLITRLSKPDSKGGKVNRGSLEHRKTSSSDASIPKTPLNRTNSNFDMSTADSEAIGNNRDLIAYSSYQARMAISRITKKAAPDYQVSQLIDLDFTQRKINMGEKTMLERGQKLEKEGDVDLAIICYTRAGAHSKDQQISKMLLGNLYFNTGQFLKALYFYSMAIRWMENKASRYIEDEFLAFFNRSIINFRLGSDEEGLKDLKKAVDLNPKDVYSRELLSLAERRMALFHESIQDAVKCKQFRSEMKHKYPNSSSHSKSKRVNGYASTRTSNASIGGITTRKHVSSVDVHMFTPSMHSLTGRDLQTSRSNRRSARGSIRSSTTSSNASNGVSFQRRADGSIVNLAKLRGIELEVPDFCTSNSLAERKIELRRVLRGDSANDNNGADAFASDAEGYLKIFKINNGLKLELFDDLFNKPTDLQNALLIPPNERSPAQLSIISSYLQQIPFMSVINDSNIKELANSIEYRALTVKDSIFDQNNVSGAVCILVNGQVEMTMETSKETDSVIDLGPIPVNSYFGHIDLLFRHPRTQLIKCIEEELVLSRKKISYHISLDNSQVLSINANKPNHSLHQGLRMNASPPPASKTNNKSGNTETRPSTSNSNNQNKSPSKPPPSPQPLLPSIPKLVRGNSRNGTGSLSNIFRNNDNSQNNDSSFMVNPKANIMRLDLNAVPQEAENAEDAFDDISLDSQMIENKDEAEFISKLKNEYDALWNVDENDCYVTRAVSSKMFMNYTMTSPCELLMISEKEFNRLFMEAAIQDLRMRLRLLISCGIFKDWKLEDIVRLSRMSQVRSFPRGEEILKQGNSPDFLYIILKGLCNVTKKPHRTEMLERQLAEAKRVAEKHDLKYVYHHKLGMGKSSPITSPRRSPLKRKQTGRAVSPQNQKNNIHFNVTENSIPEGSQSLGKKQKSSIQELADISTTVEIPPDHNTDAEIRRMELEQEIKRLEALIQKASSDNNEHDFLNTKGSIKSHQPLATLTTLSLTNKTTATDLATQLGNKTADICSLQWPKFFGEACILDPEYGVSRGTITADTPCQLLLIHKIQLQTFNIDDAFLVRVKNKSVVYPPDPELVVDLYRKQEWKYYKDDVMKDISKEKWVTPMDGNEPFTIY